MNEKKLYRSRSDKVLMGVCGGLSNYTGLDSTVWRIIVVIASLMGLGLLAYFIIGLIIPLEPEF